MADVLLKRVLDEIGLQSLVTRFEEERIDWNDVLTLSNGGLKRLGIDTIGDKYRLVLPLPRNNR